MLVIKKYGFKRQYKYGGSGIFDTMANLFSGILSKTAATNIAKSIGKTALDAGKSAGKKALDDAGKKLANKAISHASKLLTPKSKSIIQKYTQPKDEPSEQGERERPSLSSIIDAGGSKVISIQDLVHRLKKT